MPGTDLKPDQLASLWYALIANGDDADAELVTEAVPRVTLKGLDPQFTDRADGLEALTYRWAIARLKAEREALIYACLVQNASRRLDQAEAARNEKKEEKAQQKLVVAMEGHAQADAVAMGIDVALDELAKLGKFNAEHVRRVVDLGRYRSTAIWSRDPNVAPDLQTVALVVAALRQHVT